MGKERSAELGCRTELRSEKYSGDHGELTSIAPDVEALRFVWAAPVPLDAGELAWTRETREGVFGGSDWLIVLMRRSSLKVVAGTARRTFVWDSRSSESGGKLR